MMYIKFMDEEKVPAWFIFTSLHHYRPSNHPTEPEVWFSYSVSKLDDRPQMYFLYVDVFFSPSFAVLLPYLIHTFWRFI